MRKVKDLTVEEFKALLKEVLEEVLSKEGRPSSESSETEPSAEREREELLEESV